jgi:hypothetical protein
MCFLSHPIHLTWLQRLFLISQTEIHFKSITISDNSRDYGKFADGAMSDDGAIPKKAYQDCFQKWQWHWERCINAGGESFEGDKAHSVAGMSKIIIKKKQF